MKKIFVLGIVLAALSSGCTQPKPAIAPAEMVRIEGGTFTMGSPTSEPKRLADETQHSVTVSSFYMGNYEVTQKEWREVMEDDSSYFKGDTLPVENVNWYDVIEYCNKRSEREGLTSAYTIDKSRKDPNNTDFDDGLKWTVTWNRNADGYRLPTEAEWEYACRAGTTTPYNTGRKITTNQANYNRNRLYNRNPDGTYRKTTTPVGSFPPNAWGLYDMHGNVYEWCWDWFGDYPSGAQIDPTGAVSGSYRYRIIRGGAWIGNRVVLRSANRGRITAYFGRNAIGFRLARNAD